MAPMTSELRPVAKYADARRRQVDGLTVHSGMAGPTEVHVVRAGVGPDFAGRVAQRAIGALQPDHVIVCGIAGGLHPDLSVGTVVVPRTVIDLRSGRRFETHPLGRLRQEGVLATADHLITDREVLEELTATGVWGLEMESSGVASVCEASSLPWTTVRAIGDRPDEGLTDESVMSLLRPDGTSDVLGAVLMLLRHPGRFRGMAHLARDSTRAASKAARVALRAVSETTLVEDK
jgi:nucleoside phosphorylase